jgi:hypothetical protein
MRPTFLYATIPGLIFVACSNDPVPFVRSSHSPTAPGSPFAAATPSVPDVSGSWNWSAVGHLTIPFSEVRRLLDIEPEGPMTHLRCEASGTMELIQNGATFSGSATRSSMICETGEGRVVEPPLATFPSSLAVAGGSITGRGVHFLLGNVAGLGCPHNGALRHVDDEDRATELTANGRCIVPGHPKSPAPRDPPPAGTSHDTSFVATRP